MRVLALAALVVLAEAQAGPLDLEARNRLITQLEKKLVNITSYTVQYQAIRIPAGGDEKPGTEVLLFVDYLGMSWYSRTSILEEDGRRTIAHFSLKDGELYQWVEGGDAGWIDLSEFLTSVARAITATREELDRLLPPTTADPDPAVSKGIQVNINVRRRKDANDTNGGIFKYALGIFGPPASWLSDARRSRDVHATVDAASATFVFPSEQKTTVVDLDTGLLRSAETKDHDGTVRRFVRRSLVLNSARPAFTLPDRKACRTLPSGFYRNYLQAYDSEMDRAVGRLFRRWPEVEGRKREVSQLITTWGLRSLDFFLTAALEQVGDAYVKERLDGGARLADLKSGVAAEARMFGERLAKDGSLGTALRQRLLAYVDGAEKKLAAEPGFAGRVSFMEALRDGLSPETIIRKAPLVGETQLRLVLEGALRRSRGL